MIALHSEGALISIGPVALSVILRPLDTRWRGCAGPDFTRAAGARLFLRLPQTHTSPPWVVSPFQYCISSIGGARAP